MKYLIQGEIAAENPVETEFGRARIEEWIGKWQALSPIGMYFTLTRRAYTIVVDVPDEDSLSGISLAADRTWSTSTDESLFHGGLPPPVLSSSPRCSLRLSHR